MDYKIIKELVLRPGAATGKTKHFIGKEELASPVKLQIAQYPNGRGFYLFYLNTNDEIMTDTYHDTIEGAMEQSEWEFNTAAEDWNNK